MDIITYALCKKFTRETVDGILAGNTDLTQYYKKGEIENKIKDFLTSDEINELIKDFVSKTNLGSDFEIATDGTVSIADGAKGLRSSVVTSLPSKTSADPGIMYFVPLDPGGSKLQGFVFNKDKNDFIAIGDMGLDVFEPNTDTDDGKAGLVPAPAAGSNVMVLTNTGWQEGEEVNGMLYSFNWNPETANVEVAQVIDPATGDIDDTTLQYEPIEAFRGATVDTAGTYGTVPKPVPNDRTKLLKGDGTWGGVDVGEITETLSSLTAEDKVLVKTASGKFKIVLYSSLATQLGGVLKGGTVGQVFAKKSDADGDVEWVDSNILESPNGTKYRLIVADDGTLSTEVV